MSKFSDLNLLIEQANALASKDNLTKSEDRQYTVLLAEISAVKSGASLTEIRREQLNDYARRNGLAVTDFEKRDTVLTRDEERSAREFQGILKQGLESRDMSEGNVINQVGSYAGLGTFVPVEFYGKLFRAMKWIDPLFEVATVITTTHGRAMAVPVLGDIENVATPVGENSLQEAHGVDISKPGHVTLGAFSFRTPLFRLSRESFEDLETSFTARGLFETFASDRVARGFGKLAINGNGTSDRIKGIVEILSTSGQVPVIATGSATNTGGSETGANTIGSADLAALYFSVSEAYRNSPKCGWLVNDGTLQYLTTLTDKMGRPLVNIVNGIPTIMNRPVYNSPSMPSLGASNIPVIFGALDYIVIRNSVDPMTRIQVFQETPGLIEQGEYGIRWFTRHDVNIAFNDWNNSPAPLGYLQNHS